MAKFTTVMSFMAAFRHLFAAYGLPDQILSENNLHFIPKEFTKSLLVNGVMHN